MRNLLLIACCLLAACAHGPASAPVDLAAEEKAIHDLEANWTAAKDVDTFASFWSDDVVAMPPNAPVANGRQAARDALAPMFAAPGFALNFKSTRVQVANSGEMAFSYGTYTLTMNDPKGKPITDKGKYMTAYRKQADGSWKAIADIFNSDLPAPPPAK
jgi:uncharacterized protein (TIGR02246 family)